MCISVRVCVCVDYMVLKESLPVKNSWTIYRFMVLCVVGTQVTSCVMYFILV